MSEPPRVALPTAPPGSTLPPLAERVGGGSRLLLEGRSGGAASSCTANGPEVGVTHRTGPPWRPPTATASRGGSCPTEDLVVRGGVDVHPRDVEDVMLSHPTVAACAAVGRADPAYGEDVVAFVTPRPGTTATRDELVAHGRAHLAATECPREVHVVGTIPLTGVGKLDPTALRAQLPAPRTGQEHS